MFTFIDYVYNCLQHVCYCCIIRQGVDCVVLVFTSTFTIDVRILQQAAPAAGHLCATWVAILPRVAKTWSKFPVVVIRLILLVHSLAFGDLLICHCCLAKQISFVE